MGGRSSKPSARADSGSWSPKGSPRTPPPASPTPAQVVPKKPKRRLIAWLTRRKRTKEVTLNKLAEDAISPEQVFAASVTALSDSRTRPATSPERGRRGSSADARSEKLPPTDRGRSRSMTDCRSGLSEPEQSALAPDRAASIERAKSIGASIARAVQQEAVSVGSSSQSALLAETRSYGEKEMREAAMALEQAVQAALLGPGPGQKSPRGKAAKAEAARVAEVAAKARRDEAARATLFSVIVNRTVAGASVEDQMAAVREYASVCGKVLDELTSQLPTMPPAIAPGASTYLSHVGRHRAIAARALQSEDPRRAEAEAEARRKSHVARAMAAAEAREAGIDRAEPVGPSARARRQEASGRARLSAGF